VVVSAVGALVVSAGPACALTEARIVDVTCDGLRVVQTGLPPSTGFVVEAINAANGRTLAERTVRSTPGGRLDVRLRTDLHHIRRLHGEVAKAGSPDAEYGEADVSLDAHCRVTGTSPLPQPTTSATPSPRALPGDVVVDDRSTWPRGWLALGALVVLAGLASVVVAGRRRRLRRDGAP
jgi:hypothetical protein